MITVTPTQLPNTNIGTFSPASQEEGCKVMKVLGNLVPLDKQPKYNSRSPQRDSPSRISTSFGQPLMGGES